jgi:hypothetical protein
MSLTECLRGYSFCPEDGQRIRQALADFLSVLPNKTIEKMLLTNFINLLISIPMFRDLYLKLSFSDSPLVFIDGLNVSLSPQWDLLSDYSFQYAQEMPTIIQETFQNYPVRDRMAYDITNTYEISKRNYLFSLDDKIQYLKNILVLLTNNNTEPERNYVIVFKMPIDSPVPEGLYSTNIDYIYLLLVTDRSPNGSEIDDVLVTFLAYLFQKATIFTGDNYNWADGSPLRNFIDETRSQFYLIYSPYRNSIQRTFYIPARIRKDRLFILTPE